MAFTEDEKAAIREFAGWGSRFLQFDDALENALATAGEHAATAARIRTHLTELARIDTAITAAEARLKAAKVGTIELNALEIDQLRSRGRQFAARMCRALGVEARGDAFDPALPTDRQTAGGMAGGGGGYQLQG